MKCAREGCQKKPDPLNKKYCSPSCAPFAGLAGRGTPFNPAQSAISFTTARGGNLAPAFAGGKPSGDVGQLSTPSRKRTQLVSGTQPGRKSATQSPISQPRSLPVEKRNENFGQQRIGDPRPSEESPIEKRTSSTLEKYGDDGMHGTEKSTALMRPEENGAETLPTGFSKPASSLDDARSHMMNLIDESANLLLSCMRSAAKKNGEEGVRDFRDLNAICNAGKQIAQLAKVKLDAIKEARK